MTLTSMSEHSVPTSESFHLHEKWHVLTAKAFSQPASCQKYPTTSSPVNSFFFLVSSKLLSMREKAAPATKWPSALGLCEVLLKGFTVVGFLFRPSPFNCHWLEHVPKNYYHLPSRKAQTFQKHHTLPSGVLSSQGLPSSHSLPPSFYSNKTRAGIFLCAWLGCRLS